MNYTTAVMLINTNIRAVNVIYEKDKENSKAKRVMFKTLDQNLKVGDLVVIPTDADHRHGFTVAKVDAVDVDVDFDSATKVEWIADIFDDAAYEKLLVEEQQYIELIKKGEQLKRRKDIAANLDALSVEGLKELPIANYGDKLAISDATLPGGADDTLKA